MNNLIQTITDYTTALEQKLSALEARVAELEEANEAMRREGDEGMIYLAGAPYFDISSTEIRKNLHK